jgi:hypothetical protein
MNFSDMFFSHAEEKARVEGLAGADFCLWLRVLKNSDVSQKLKQ